MSYLYIDTTNNLYIGLLNEDFNWIDQRSFETKKTSEIIHFEILQLLAFHNLELSKLEGVISLAGPGSYTGMRVSEGIIQILEMEGIKVYSFHAILFAKLLTTKWDFWFYPAFKNEYYIQSFDGQEKLVDAQDFIQSFDSSLTYASFGHSLEGFTNVIDSKSFLKDDCSEVFKYVVDNDMRQSLFYFRNIDQEFTKSMK